MSSTVISRYVAQLFFSHLLPLFLTTLPTPRSRNSTLSQVSQLTREHVQENSADLPPQTKRSMQEYFKRVALRLGAQARERRDAEGGAGGLGLGDEMEDEREVWSVGRVDLEPNTLE